MSPLHAFASPQHGTAAERAVLLRAARAARAERIVRALLSRSRGDLPSTVIEALEGLPARASTHPADADRAMTHLSGAHVHEGSLLPAAVRALVAASGPIAFAAELPAPLRLRWRGIITPPAVAVTFEPGASEILRVRSRSGETLDLTADDPRAVAAPRIRFGAGMLDLMPAWTLDTYSYVPDEIESSPLETPVLVKQTAETVSYLAAAAPEYFTWVEQVLAELLPLDGRDGRLRSRSNPLTPGRISATFPSVPIVLAELLVHESSHLYFDLARELAPLDDGSDTTLYWSPVKQQGRPIDRILLAFHAWANLCALFRSCMEHDLDIDGYAARNLPTVRGQMKELLRSLERTSALTDAGRAFWTPFAGDALA